jgi:integrase
MGSVYRKSYTKPMPPEAEIVMRKGQRHARWQDPGGKPRTAPITIGKGGEERIRVEARTFVAKYRDGNGLVVESPTGCRTEDAARQVLADLERKAERVRAGLLTPAEARTAGHITRPIGEHVRAYLDFLTAAGSVEHHRRNVRIYLDRLIADCGFVRLGDLTRDALEKWLAVEVKAGRSARSRNTHRASAIAFGNWCVASGRLIVNPLKGIPKADENADPRRRRRATTAMELNRLLDVARHRPLTDARTVRRGKGKRQSVAKLRPETVARLEAVGRERALIYKSLVLTGLRRGELASLTVGKLQLDAPTPYVELDAADEKSREGNDITIRPDLADDIRHWLADKLAAAQRKAREDGSPIPSRLPSNEPVFTVPVALVKILDRDLRNAATRIGVLG